MLKSFVCIYVFNFSICIFIYIHVFSIFRYIHIYPFRSLHETLKKTRCNVTRTGSSKKMRNLDHTKNLRMMFMHRHQAIRPPPYVPCYDAKLRSWWDAVGGLGVIVIQRRQVQVGNLEMDSALWISVFMRELTIFHVFFGGKPVFFWLVHIKF